MKRRSSGYTIVELMMALTVLGIGVTGIIAMQKVTSVSNQHAKNLAVATRIAEAWQEQLAADAVAWNRPAPKAPGDDLASDTRWLGLVTTKADTWVQPDYDATRAFGPAFDALGNPVALPADLAKAKYCTNIRLSWLYPAAAGVASPPGSGLLRAEVRVFWQRDGASTALAFCAVGSTPSVGTAVETYHFVYKASAVRQNPARP